MPHDLWLTGQMGVALLWHCDSTHQLTEGFSVLYCLHESGIHYVTATPPYAMTPPPTPCSIALKAVLLCLKVWKEGEGGGGRGEREGRERGKEGEREGGG